MKTKVLQVFYGADALPYKDKERTVHFPIVGNAIQNANNTTQINFYFDRLIEENEQTTFVAVSKLPNGKIGSKILETYNDEELGEHYALLDLDSFYTQYKGDVFISLQGYQGGVRVEQDEQGIYQIYGTPVIAATGSIKLAINYAPSFVGSGETENVTLQQVLGELSTKLGVRQQTLHVEELPAVGNPDIWYVVNDDPNDATKDNIYIWNATTQTYVWVGDNTLDLGDYYTQEEGQEFEQEVRETIGNGSPKGVYATLSDLESAYPTGTTGIYVVSADGHWYYWNGSAWTDGGVYQATQLDNETLSKIENGYLLKQKLDNLNLFNVNDATKIENCYVDTDGTLTTLNGWNTYKINTNGKSKIDFLAKDFVTPLYIIYGAFDTTDSILSHDDNTQFVKWTVSLPQGTEYILISIQATQENNLLALLQNDIIYELKYNYAKEEEILNLLQNKDFNLINKDLCVDNYYVQYNDGRIFALSNFTITPLLKVFSGVKYSFSGGTTESSQCAFYDKDLQYISGIVTGEGTDIVAPNNACYVMWCFATANKNSAKIVVNIENTQKIYASKNELYNLIQGQPFNLIDKNTCIDGYFVDYTTGNLISYNEFSVTDYIEITPDVEYLFENGSSNADSQCAFYDSTKTFITGYLTRENYIAKAPSNAKYVRWCFKITDKQNAIVSVNPRKNEEYRITTSIGLLQGVINAYQGNYKKIIVSKGQYDLIQEYKNKYGENYFEDYTSGYNGYANGMYDAGVWLENIEIIFESGSKVNCNYTGDNAFVKGDFSAFAVGRNATINGLVLDASNLRYGIHADFNGNSEEESIFSIKNCDLKFEEGTDYQSLGCGLPITGYWVFENNIFRGGNSNGIVLRVHNNISSNAISKIIVKDNIIIDNGHFEFNYYSTSQHITNVLISGNSWKNEPVSRDESSSSYININLVEWNNELRS